MAHPRRRHAFGRELPGQWRRVSLPADEQSLLNTMDRALEARDPRLASLFATFTKLTRDQGPPRTERLVPSPGRLAAWRRAPYRLARASVAIPIVLAASLMAAIIAIGMATSGWSACSPVLQHPRMHSRVAACGSVNGPAK
jgi:hypothetical protein